MTNGKGEFGEGKHLEGWTLVQVRDEQASDGGGVGDRAGATGREQGGGHANIC